MGRIWQDPPIPSLFSLSFPWHLAVSADNQSGLRAVDAKYAVFDDAYDINLRRQRDLNAAAELEFLERLDDALKAAGLYTTAQMINDPGMERLYHLSTRGVMSRSGKFNRTIERASGTLIRERTELMRSWLCQWMADMTFWPYQLMARLSYKYVQLEASTADGIQLKHYDHEEYAVFAGTMSASMTTQIPRPPAMTKTALPAAVVSAASNTASQSSMSSSSSVAHVRVTDITPILETQVRAAASTIDASSNLYTNDYEDNEVIQDITYAEKDKKGGREVVNDPILPVQHRKVVMKTAEPSTPATGNTITGSNGSYLLYASSPVPTGQAGAVVGASVLQKFISSTESGTLTLQSALGQIEASLAMDQDLWWLTLGLGPLKLSSPQILGAASDATAGTLTMSLILTILSRQISFSSSNADLSAALGLSSTTDMTQDACLSNYGYISLAATTPTDTTKFKLSELLAELGPGWIQPAAGVVAKLPGLSDNPDVTLATGGGSRSMLTFSPKLSYRHWLRLQINFEGETTFLTHFNDMFGHIIPHLVAQNIFLIIHKDVSITRNVTSANISDSSEIVLEAKCLFNGNRPVTIIVRFGQLQTCFILQFDGDTTEHQGVPDNVLAAGIVSGDQSSPSSLVPDVGTELALRDIRLVLTNPVANAKFAVEEASVRFEIDVFNAKFLATVGAEPPQFSFSLWTNIPVDHNNAMLAYFESTDVLAPRRTSAATGVLPLTNLIPGADKAGRPSWLSLDVVKANFLCLGQSGQGVSMVLNGEIEYDPSSSNANEVPIFRLDSVEIEASCSSFAKGAVTWDVKLNASAALLPRNPIYDPILLYAFMQASSDGEGTTWQLNAAVTDLQFAALYSMFHPDDADPVMDFLEHFEIPSLALQYTYGPSGSEFEVNGVLQIGDVSLGLLYKHTGADWSIRADIGFLQTDMTLVGLLASVINDPNNEVILALDAVPFIRDIKFEPIAPLPGDEVPDDPPIELMVTKTPGGMSMVFRIAVDTPIGAVSVVFVQHTPVKGTNGSKPTSGTKRIVRVRIDKLPQLPEIPIVGQIGQPIDSLDYMFVSDPGVVGSDPSKTGFTSAEIDDINQIEVSPPNIRFISFYVPVIYISLTYSLKGA